MRAHARHRGLGIGAGELELDIEIKLLEALLAADLGSRRAREAREQVAHDRWIRERRSCQASLLLFVQAQAARRERASELLSPVVQGLVEGAAGRVQPLGEHVDRHLVQGERDEHLALVGAQLLLDRLVQRTELIGRLDRLLCGALVLVGDQRPCLGRSGISRPCQERFRTLAAASYSANL